MFSTEFTVSPKGVTNCFIILISNLGCQIEYNLNQLKPKQLGTLVIDLSSLSHGGKSHIDSSSSEDTKPTLNLGYISCGIPNRRTCRRQAFGFALLALTLKLYPAPETLLLTLLTEYWNPLYFFKAHLSWQPGNLAGKTVSLPPFTTSSCLHSLESSRTVIILSVLKGNQQWEATMFWQDDPHFRINDKDPLVDI